jgi:isoleucyl-tRNA synthetase
VIDKNLEERMELAQRISSMILALRRKVNIKVRQPLGKIMVPVSEKGLDKKIDKVKELILSEVNVKELEYIDDASGILVKKIKPDFKKLGPRIGKMMKEVASAINSMKQEEIIRFEKEGSFVINTSHENIELTLSDVEIISEDIPGWLVANEGNVTVALDITVTEELKDEGTARELVNRIQNLRKDSGFNVTDKINIFIQKNQVINSSVEKHRGYIASQTLAVKVDLVDKVNSEMARIVDIDENVNIAIKIERI